jgi:hypothetical protein
MQPKRWTRKRLLLYAAIVCITIFLLIELVFRIVFWVQTKEYDTSVNIQGNTLQVDDSVLIFRNRPYYLDYQRRFQHNEEGMRSEPGDTKMPPKQPGDFWVFLLGGSAMEGMGSNKDGEWQDITGIEDYAYNETIAYYLQQKLQQAMPGKKVRVFNAANTSFTIEQSFLRYQQLSARFDIDWVISMDGQNNPPLLGKDQRVLDHVRTDWEENPSKKFPLNWIIPITTHSAFVTWLKQNIFHSRQRTRLARARNNDFPRAQYWRNNPGNSLVARTPDDSTRNAVNAFYQQLHHFDSTLTARNQHHLLLLQPHLIFRDTTLLQPTEKALLHYYRNAYGHPAINSFLLQLRAEFPQRYAIDSGTVQLLNETDTLSQQVFVDYCHFTRQTNEFIASLLANHILSRSK